VPFAYYQRLTAAQKRIYRKSDALTSIELPGAAELRPLAGELAAALAADDRREVERVCRALAEGICSRLGAPPVQVRVLSARPSGDYGELHGLYDPAFTPPRITIWMRTAAKRRVVAFKSFLRTLVHELLHHFDYELYAMEETFHTEGFFQRESSLTRQLLGEPPAPPASAGAARRRRVSSG
jgi:hypothetical protein